MEERPKTSNVSVDVLTLRYNAVDRRVEIAVAPRASEPYVGQLALAGVTLWEGERLADAARRAVRDKLGLDVKGLGQLTVFDEPNRDPRGFTLSVAMWAVASSMVEKRPSGSRKRLSCTSSLHMLTSPKRTGPEPASTLKS